MKTKLTLLAFLSAVALSTSFAADNAFMGTWKLDEAKSKIPDGMPKNRTVVYAASGDQVTVTVDGELKGKAAHHVWTGKFDGKDYPVKGSDMHDMRAYTQVDDHTLTYTVKKGGKQVGTGKVVVAADGKSRTTSETDVGPDGKKMSMTGVYTKQ